MPSLTSPPLEAGALSGKPQRSLPGDGVLLRPWQDDDAAALVDAYRDPDIQWWHCFSLDDEREAVAMIGRWRAGWAGDSGASWAVTDPADDRLLGRMALRTVELDDACGEVAYWVVPAARGRKVATRAVATLSGWAFDEIGFQRLEVFHSVANQASCRVAEAAGFSLEGVLRELVLHQDGWHDMHLHARLRSEHTA